MGLSGSGCQSVGAVQDVEVGKRSGLLDGEPVGGQGGREVRFYFFQED